MKREYIQYSYNDYIFKYVLCKHAEEDEPLSPRQFYNYVYISRKNNHPQRKYGEIL